jgi:hypothetical protein
MRDVLLGVHLGTPEDYIKIFMSISGSITRVVYTYL